MTTEMCVNVGRGGFRPLAPAHSPSVVDRGDTCRPFEARGVLPESLEELPPRLIDVNRPLVPRRLVASDLCESHAPAATAGEADRAVLQKGGGFGGRREWRTVTRTRILTR